MRGDRPFAGLRRRALSTLGLAGGVPATDERGKYAAAIRPPHGLSETIHANQLDAMSADAGLRLARSRGQRTYRGGALALHSFDSGQGGPATEAVLDAIPLQAGNRRRALGTFRGTLDGWAAEQEPAA